MYGNCSALMKLRLRSSIGSIPISAARRVHGPLDGVGGLGPSGAAVGVGGRHRREDRRAAEVVGRRQVVDAGVEEGAEQRDAGRDQLEVGAHVGEQADPDGGQLAVLVGGQLDVLDLPAALDGGHARSRCAPRSSARGRRACLARATQSSSSAYTSSFEPKAPPTLGATTRIVLLGDAERQRGHDLEDVRDLGRRVERHAPRRRAAGTAATARGSIAMGIRRCWM